MPHLMSGQHWLASPGQGAARKTPPPTAPATPVVPGHLPVTCQRGDGRGGEHSRVLPIGHQLHHLGLEGHVCGIHGGEAAGLSAGSPGLCKKGTGVSALGRSAGGAGLGTHKSASTGDAGVGLSTSAGGTVGTGTGGWQGCLCRHGCGWTSPFCPLSTQQSSPQLQQPHEGPQVGLSPRPPSHPTSHPAEPHSCAHSTVPAQPQSLCP